MDPFVRGKLSEAGLAEYIGVFQENVIDESVFLTLTLEDLHLMLPKRVGIVKKVAALIESLRAPSVCCAGPPPPQLLTSDPYPPPMMYSHLAPMPMMNYLPPAGDYGPECHYMNAGPMSFMSMPMVPPHPPPPPEPTSLPSQRVKRTRRVNSRASVQCSNGLVDEMSAMSVSVSVAEVQFDSGVSGSEECPSEVSNVDPSGYDGSYPALSTPLTSEISSPLTESTEDLCDTMEVESQCSEIASGASVEDNRDSTESPSCDTIREFIHANIVDRRPHLIVKDPMETKMEVSIHKPHHRFIRDSRRKRGSQLKKLEEQYGVRFTFPKTNDSCNLIGICGQRDAVKKAAEEMHRISDAHADETSKKLLIKSEHRPFMCGPSPRNDLVVLTKEVEGIKISIRPESNLWHAIYVDGKRSAVDQVMDQLEKKYAEVKTYNKTKMKVEKSQHKAIFVHKRQHAEDIFQEYGVIMEVSPQDSPDPWIYFTGPCNAIIKAIKWVEGKASTMAETTEVIHVNAEYHRHLIGKDGSFINPIRNDTGTRINFPEPTERKNEISIIGKKDAVAKAKLQIEQRLAEIVKNTKVEMDVEPTFHDNFLRYRAKLVRQVERDYRVRIDFPKKGSLTDKVVIKGIPESVQEAKERISSIVCELEQERSRKGSIETSDSDPSSPSPSITTDVNMNYLGQKAEPFTKNVELDPCVYSRIIGVNGKKIRQIELEHNVHIQFPRPTSDFPNMVEIRGRNQASVWAVRDTLQDMEKRYIPTTIKPKCPTGDIRVT